MKTSQDLGFCYQYLYLKYRQFCTTFLESTAIRHHLNFFAQRCLKAYKLEIDY